MGLEDICSPVARWLEAVSLLLGSQPLLANFQVLSAWGSPHKRVWEPETWAVGT